MNEFSFIESIKQKTYKQPTLLKGIGDDAAVFKQSTENIVTSVDTFVDGVHFSRTTMEPFYMGYRALAANISDLAAMGATPAFYLVSIIIPKTWTETDIQDIFAGMKSLATHHAMDLIGGDTVSGKELAISITVIGYVAPLKIRYRHLAQPQDVVFVTGTLGDSQAGLHILQNPGEYTDSNYFISRHQTPTPRVSFAKKLEPISRVALNDISDGIASEASEIAKASGVSIHLIEKNIPLHSAMMQFDESLRSQWSLFGGEDFELLGTVSERDWPLVVKAAKQTNTKLTKIGYVSGVSEPGQIFLKSKISNKFERLERKGYTHLD